MPDLKISQLPLIPATALTDVFATVPSGSAQTYKVTLESIKDFLVPFVLNSAGIPNQTGQGGKVLGTNGVNMFWTLPPVPTLNQVLTTGNSSTKEIVLDGITHDLVMSAQDPFFGDFGTFLIRNLITGEEHRTGIDRSIYRHNGKGLQIARQNLDNDYFLTYPKSNGTLVTKVNGVFADANGNVNIAVGGLQNLQQVLTQGNSANIGIELNSPTVNDTQWNGLKVFDSDTNSIYVRPTSIYFDGEEGETLLQFLNVTGGPLTINTPQANGTLALSVNNNVADANGNITLDINDIGIPTLDEVLTEGNTSDVEIDLTEWFRSSKGLKINDPFLGSDWQITTKSQSGVGLDGILQMFNTFYPNFPTYEFGIGGLWMTKPTSFSTNASTVLSMNNITQNNALDFPNASGTLVLSVNGVTADANGDITLSVGNSQTLQQTTDLGNTTSNDIVLQDASLTGIDTLEFDLTPATTTQQEGRVRWNDELKTLQIDTENNNVQINVGHETIQRVRNVTGSTITKGKVIYINGESGNRPTIALADNSTDLTSANTIGVVIADIPNNNNGYVITNGLLENINTTGLTAGQTLYLSTNGNYTTTKPIAPNHLVYVGKVISVGATGSIFITIQNGYELDELHDCLITTPQNNEVLTYESTTGLWKNKTAQTGNGLPSQTGQSGKYLTTNGTTASWNTLPTQLDTWSLSAGFTNFTLSASETYVFGHMFGASQPVTLFNARPSRQMIAPKTGFLKRVSIMTSATTFASVSPPDDLQIQIRIGGTVNTIVASYPMSSGTFTSLSKHQLFTGFNFPCNQSDIIDVRLVVPAWATAPTGVNMVVNLYFENL